MTSQPLAITQHIAIQNHTKLAQTPLKPRHPPPTTRPFPSVSTHISLSLFFFSDGLLRARPLRRPTGVHPAADRRRHRLVGRRRRLRPRRLAQGEHQPQVHPQEPPPRRPQRRVAEVLRQPQAHGGAHHRDIGEARAGRQEPPPPAGDVPQEGGRHGRRRPQPQGGRPRARADVAQGLLHRQGPLRP